MKIPFCFILSLLSIFIINAQETQKNQLNKKNQKTGNWIGYHKETDTRRYNGNFIEGKPVGLFTYYAKEGHV